MRIYDDDEELTDEERHERKMNDLACLWDDSDDHLMPRRERSVNRNEKYRHAQ